MYVIRVSVRMCAIVRALQQGQKSSFFGRRVVASGCFSHSILLNKYTYPSFIRFFLLLHFVRICIVVLKIHTHTGTCVSDVKIKRTLLCVNQMIQ